MAVKKVSKGFIYLLISFIILVIGAIIAYVYLCEKYEGDDQWIYIDKNCSESQLKDSLMSKLGDDFGAKVYQLWSLRDDYIANNQGAYKIKSGSSAWKISKDISENHQTPVKVIFNNVRTMEQLANRVSKNMQFNEAEFLAACDSVLSQKGFKKEEFPAVFFPDSYEFYWNAKPTLVVERLLKYYDKYWSDENISKAKSMGISPLEVSTIASIVEEETNKADERPKVARLYLNRVKKGMKLQADPTLKFAIGDFSLRRINQNHLKVESPYNTYQHAGLPPGPIRIVSKKTLDAVLNAPEHEYIYMCAKEDFSGYHNFAVDYDTHQANARRYQQELNRRKIK